MSKFFKTILGLSVSLFLLVQIQRFLNFGTFTYVLYFIELVLFIAIIITLFIGIYKWMNNPNRSHKIILWISSILLGLIIYKPFGLITDKMIYGEHVLFAYEEGVASCSSSFSFKKNGIYIQESICFGTERKVGNYTIKNDTILLDTTKINQYKFGVINRKDSSLVMYLSHPRTIKDFNPKMDSSFVKQKIKQSEKAYFKIYTINEL